VSAAAEQIEAFQRVFFILRATRSRKVEVPSSAHSLSLDAAGCSRGPENSSRPLDLCFILLAS
jgi:hypothetical protein